MSTPTPEQIDALLTFLEEHRDLARGYMRSTSGRHRARLLWARLTDQLNALAGCKKNVKQWQKVWTDKKYLAKKAVSLSGSRSEPTTTVSLTPLEQRIIAVIKEVRVKTSASVPAYSQLEEEETEVFTIPWPDTEQQDQREQNTQLRGRIPPVPPMAQRRKRRRLDTAGDEQSVRRKLFEMEERRRAADARRSRELTLIRQAVHQLSRVLQDGLQELVEELRTWRK